MASWPNLPVKSINQPRCKVLVLKYTGSMVHTLLLLQAWSVRDLHVRISHVSLMFHSILMDASKLQFQTCWVRSCLRFPMVDCYLPVSYHEITDVCSHAGSFLFLRSRGVRSTQGWCAWSSRLHRTLWHEIDRVRSHRIGCYVEFHVKACWSEFHSRFILMM